MKPRHTAALVLVGWYLMSPPFLSPGKRDQNAPLSRWDQESEPPGGWPLFHPGAHEQEYIVGQPLTAGLIYDTEADCLAGRSVWIEVGERLTQQTGDSAFLNYRSDRCVSSDDPRLKGN